MQVGLQANVQAAAVATAVAALALGGCGTYRELTPGAQAVTATVTQPAGKCVACVRGE